MLDLYNKKYNRNDLKDNIYSVKLIDILKTQVLDIQFIVRYILNKKYQIHKEDNISSPLVLKYQSHISYNDLQKALIDYDSDDDSIDNFEIVSNK
jgi:hypothetical protein